MDIITLARIGLKQASASIPEALYLKTGVDMTRPTWIRGFVNERCNYKCLQCGCWRLDRYEEMTTSQWKEALAGLRAFLGSYTIQFSGGEPFIKKGFLELLEFCREQSIDYGVITNGSAFLNSSVVARLVATQPLNVDVSVDGPTPEIHDELRGVPGSLDAIVRGIGALRSEQRRTGVRFPVRIKPTINAVNFRSMPALVSWAVAVGASTIDFEPMNIWTDETRGKLWPTPADVVELEPIVAELLRLKADGLPIETPEHLLKQMPAHFLHQPVTPQIKTCLSGLRMFNIDPRGLVSTCGEFGPIGDLKTQSAKEIWQGLAARENRRQTTACSKGCAFGCMPKPLKDKVRRGLTVLRGGGNDTQC